MKKILILLLAALFVVIMPDCKKKFVRLMAVKTVSVDQTTYTIKGEVIDVGDGSPQYGFCWSTQPNPTLADANVNLGTTSSPKAFQFTLTGLASGIKYYFRAYAKGGGETVLGEILNFTIPSGEIEIIFDDGIYEYLWRFDPGYTGSLGNEFPVTSSGTITGVKMYFHTGSNDGDGAVGVDIYDQHQTWSGSLIDFVPPADNWITRTANVNFSNKFFVMVYWYATSGLTKYLGYDENGPWAPSDLEWYIIGGNWYKLSGDGKPSGVFLLRVFAMIYSHKAIPQPVEFAAKDCGTRIQSGKDLPEGLKSSNP